MTFDPTTEFDPVMMTPSSTTVLWEGTSQDLMNKATGGHVTNASYKITEDGIHFASGLVSTKEEIVPLWAVRDVDLKQGWSQKARHVGSLTLKIDDAAAATYGQLDLQIKSVPDPHSVRAVILKQANETRTYWNNRRHQLHIEEQRAGATQINTAAAPVQAPAPTAAPQDDLMSQLTRLGDMKEAGLLTEEEFAAAKAKLLT
jgi:Bacterial PH domain/Short C-terminal domain